MLSTTLADIAEVDVTTHFCCRVAILVSKHLFKFADMLLKFTIQRAVYVKHPGNEYWLDVDKKMKAIATKFGNDARKISQ